MSNVDIGPRKTAVVIVIVVGCFAVLWPKVFYPMLMGSFNQPIKPTPIDKSTGCCDMIWETDVNAIRVMENLCGNILHQQSDEDLQLKLGIEYGKLSKDIISDCRREILAKCNVDIAAVLSENIRLGRSYRQILDELRSTNSSLCLKYNFGVTPLTLGVPHRIAINLKQTDSMRQERPAHMRPEMVHPALREKGRAIPQSPHPHMVSRVVEGRPGPVPGMRPVMGGAGHVVPPPKTSTSTMGIVMPIYTIGIVIFFLYTLMKIMFRKQNNASTLYPPLQTDPVFRKRVFNEQYTIPSSTDNGERLRSRLPPTEVSRKLVVTALSDMLNEVDQRREYLAKQRQEIQKLAEDDRKASNFHAHLESTDNEIHVSPVNGHYKQANGQIIEHTQNHDTTFENKVNLNEKSNNTENEEPVFVNKEQIFENKKNIPESETFEQDDIEIQQTDDQEETATIKVLNMEVTASCEGGQKWSRPSTPIIPPLQLSSSNTPSPAQSIFLEGSVPAQSQIVFEKSAVNMEEQTMSTQENGDEGVILSGKVTLTVIAADNNDDGDKAQDKTNEINTKTEDLDQSVSTTVVTQEDTPAGEENVDNQNNEEENENEESDEEENGNEENEDEENEAEDSGNEEKRLPESRVEEQKEKDEKKEEIKPSDHNAKPVYKDYTGQELESDEELVEIEVDEDDEEEEEEEEEEEGEEDNI